MASSNEGTLRGLATPLAVDASDYSRLMTELVLQASDDLVARLAHEGHPVRAVVELVWNAIDGEAHTVMVQLERNAMDAISAVRVEDD